MQQYQRLVGGDQNTTLKDGTLSFPRAYAITRHLHGDKVLGVLVEGRGLRRNVSAARSEANGNRRTVARQHYLV